MPGLFAGNVDVSRHSHAEGWAAQGRDKTDVRVFVNDQLIGEISPTRDRPDVEAVGFALQSGWSFPYAQPLDADDNVQFRFSDGSPIPFGAGADHKTRVRSLTHGLDARTMAGLELGPLNCPLLGKGRWDITYVDHASRGEIECKYAGFLALDRRQALVDIDVIWSGGSLVSRLAGRRFDFAVASHVIEHVPDMIHWLDAIAAALKPGGLINLAVPDRDRTFDRFREPTRPAEIVDDYMHRLERPSARHIFDHVCHVAEEGQDPQYRPVEALAAVRAAEAERSYLDVHCRVFTCESFLSVFRTLVDAGLLRLELAAFFPTRPATNEFIASLRKPAPDAGIGDMAGGFARCLAAMPALRAEVAAGAVAVWAGPSWARVVVVDERRETTTWDGRLDRQ